MNTFIFTSPLFRPLDASGAVMPNAYLQFYVTQTTTPTPVYADVDLNTERANPYVSDGTGQFGVMYMDPVVTYRVQLYDADDVLQWDIDPYTPPRDFAPGTVLEFYGTEAQLEAAYPPALWQQLDGNNGAPDARNRFTICVGTNGPGDIGGGTGATVTGEAGAIAAGETGETILDDDDMPVHNHRLYVRTSSTQRGNTRGFGFSGTAGVEGQIIDDAPYGYLDVAPESDGNTLIEPTGTADPTGHIHTVPAIPDHDHSITPELPPWVALWKIMRRYP